MACAECTEQLEFARGFQRGLKTMVAEDAVQAAIVQARRAEEHGKLVRAAKKG